MKPSRALIVAVAAYPQADRLAPLPNVVHEARRAYEWLLTQTEAENVIACVSPQQPWSDHPATYDGVKAALAKVCRVQNATSTLLVYLAGHGFSLIDDEGGDRITTALFLGDYAGDARGRIKVNNLNQLLLRFVGAENMLTVIDVCRNEAENGTTPLEYEATRAARPLRCLVVHSTPEGQTAGASSPFAAALIDGLCGAGRAKRRAEAGYEVVYTDLVDHIRITVPDVDAQPDAADLVVARIREVPNTTLTVEVAGATDGQVFVLRLKSSWSERIETSFTGPRGSVALKPDNYSYHIGDAADSASSDFGSIDCYEDATLRFELGGGSPGPVDPADSHDSHSDDVSESAVGDDDFVIREEDFAINDNYHVAHAIFPASVWRRYVEDESSATGEQGDDIWASLEYWQVEFPPLATRRSASDPEPTAPLTIETASFLESLGRVGTESLSSLPLVFVFPDGIDGGLPDGIELGTVGPGLRGYGLPAEPGVVAVRIHLPGHRDLIVMAVAAPDCHNVCVVTGPVAPLLQFCLPALGLEKDDQRCLLVQDGVELYVALVAEAQVRFISGRPMNNPEFDRFYQAIQVGGFRDPVMSSLVGYDLLRWGAHEAARDIASRLVEDYPYLPDGKAIAALASGHEPEPGSPLVADGWVATAQDSADETFVFDYEMGWTGWRRSTVPRHR